MIQFDESQFREGLDPSGESRRQLSTLIGNLPGIAYRCGVAAPWVLDYVSGGAREITGYDATQWMQGHVAWAHIVHPDDLPRLETEVAAAIAAGVGFSFGYRIRHASGETRWLHERGQAVYGADGQPLHLEGFIGDVTEQKLLEQSLRDAQAQAQLTSERLSAVLEGTLDCVYSLDRQMRFTYMNPRAIEHYGNGRSLVGESIAEIVPGSASSEFADCYARVMRSRRAESIESYFLPWRRWYEAHVTPTEGGITVFYRDISPRKEAEAALRESTERARSILDSVPQILWSCDAAGRCNYLSPQWREFTGRDHHADMIAGWTAAVHPDDRPRVRAEWASSVARAAPFDVEFRLRSMTGAYRWILTRALPEQDRSGSITGWYGTCTDVHERVLAQQALLESEALNRSMLEASPDCTALLDDKGRILFLNRPGPCSTLDGDAPPPLGRRWLDLLPGDAVAEARKALARAWSGETARFTVAQPGPGGPRWWDVAATPVKAACGAIRLLVVSRDVSHQKQSEERVRWIANHDPLTGLPNRLLFQEHLDGIARDAGESGGFSLLLLDVDDFKRVNDSLGHDAGDSLLCAFAERLRAAIRSDDFVARLGGDEFAVILNAARTPAEVTAAVDAILTELRQPHFHSGRILDCNASIGASIFPIHGTARAELLKHADIALYVAKASWRGNLRIFDAGMRSDMQHRMSMLGIARDALKRDLILPYYQPKVDLRTGGVSGFEALLRWRHNRRGIQTPDTIAAAFDDLSTAAEISDRMIDRVILDMRCWLDRGVEFRQIAINAAAAEFRRGDFAESLLERLHRAGIEACRLQLEVTETVFLGRGADFVERALKTLSTAGVQIALDDFGTGYASLSHLKQFPVDVLKIDRSFVAELCQNDDAAAIIRAVINLGHSLDIAVVAEGIETQEQERLLAGSGCHLGQGHLYSPAAPAEDVPMLLARLNRERRAA
jgi:diguanylate cyclase (GGDEF)-like protein/PAS domain S-box-containing protein